MSATYQLEYTRFVKRGMSDLMTVTAMEAMTSLAYARLVAADWSAVTEQESDLPTHKWDQTGFLGSYDAAKYCGDYSNGKQKAYASAVSYTIKVPVEALAGTIAKVESIAATLYGDRWTSCGAVLSILLTSSATPPVWTDVLAATYTTPYPVTAESDVDPTWQAPAQKAYSFKFRCRHVLRCHSCSRKWCQHYRVSAHRAKAWRLHRESRSVD